MRDREEIPAAVHSAVTRVMREAAAGRASERIGWLRLVRDRTITLESPFMRSLRLRLEVVLDLGNGDVVRSAVVSAADRLESRAGFEAALVEGILAGVDGDPDWGGPSGGGV